MLVEIKDLLSPMSSFFTKSTSVNTPVHYFIIYINTKVGYFPHKTTT